ncbi:MAG: NACHT domain-containing protein [Anaerolineaceae bacterium]|nr:NACHT domain-containing protein [Anaerolineaceae bacterium]
MDMDSRKPLCIILWITQVLFVLLGVAVVVLWVSSAANWLGEDGFWIFNQDNEAVLEPLLTFVTFVLVGGNSYLLHVVCGDDKAKEPSLGGPKKLTNRTYRQYIRYRFRDFNVKGLSTHGPYTLELARVYVELSVAPKPFHAASSNIIQLPEKLQSGRHDIWAYVQQTEQNFAIIGPPGSGKTTLLSHIALTLTQNWFQLRKEGLPNKLPILLTLLEHTEAIAAKGDEQFAMEDAVRADLTKWKKEVPEGWVRRSLDKGRYLVLLDGLDEVADKAQRQKVVTWVERQMKAYPKCQFINQIKPLPLAVEKVMVPPVY